VIIGEGFDANGLSAAVVHVAGRKMISQVEPAQSYWEQPTRHGFHDNDFA